jgi:hypothetical protein
MSNYAITRIKKLKTISKISAAGKHNSRADHAPNADPNGTCKLLIGSNTPEKAFNDLMDKTGIKPRKNAVLGVEMLFTFSPEMKGKIELSEWIKEHEKFINNEFPRGSVLSAHLHLDETTPHIQLIIAPIVKKTVRKKMQWRLACKDYFGTPEKLRQYQDRYASAMSVFGLERGIRGSKARHKTIKSLYSEAKNEMEKAKAEIQKIEDDLSEKPSFFNAKSVFGNMKKVLENFKKVLVQAGKVPQLEDRNRQLNAETSKYKRILRTVRAAFNDAPTDEIITVLKAKKAEIDAEKSQKYSEENQILIKPKTHLSDNEPKPEKTPDLGEGMTF